MANYKNFSTVGELINILQELPQDMLILTNEHNMEKRGYSKNTCINVEPRKFKIIREDTYDAFDGIPYSYDAIIPNDEGDIEAIII